LQKKIVIRKHFNQLTYITIKPIQRLYPNTEIPAKPLQRTYKNTPCTSTCPHAPWKWQSAS